MLPLDGLKAILHAEARKRQKAPKSAEDLKRLAGGADEISQGRNVWAVSANPPGIHRKAQAFGQIQIQTCIVEFRQAEPRCR